MTLPQLRVKIKNLAGEARDIRHEERKIIGHPRVYGEDDLRLMATPDLEAAGLGKEQKARRRLLRRRKVGQISYHRDRQQLADAERKHAEFTNLQWHRTHIVRRQARASLLAYGFLRGVPFRRIEPGEGKLPAWVSEHLIELAARFGERPKTTAEREVTAWLKGSS